MDAATPIRVLSQDPCNFIPGQMRNLGYDWPQGSYCAEIDSTDWNGVRDRYGNYGTLPDGSACPHSSDFASWFDDSWNADKYKLEFDWMRNPKRQQIGGFHDPGHFVIGWRTDYNPDNLLHEVLHHRLGSDENMVLDSTAAYGNNCVKTNKPERPKGSRRGGGSPSVPGSDPILGVDVSCNFVFNPLGGNPNCVTVSFIGAEGWYYDSNLGTSIWFSATEDGMVSATYCMPDGEWEEICAIEE